MNALASPLFASYQTVTSVLVQLAGPSDSMSFSLALVVLTLATFFVVIHLMRRVTGLASHLLQSAATVAVGLVAFLTVVIAIVLTTVVLLFTYR